MDKKEETLQEQVGLVVRALRADLESIRELAIAQLSLFGPKATPYLIAALDKALEESEQIKEKRYTDYRYRNPILSPEYEISGILRTFWFTSDSSTIPSIVKAFPRREAVFALGRIGTVEALNTMITTIPQWYKPRNKFENLCEDEDINTVFSYFGKEKGTQLRNYLEKTDSETKVKIMRILSLLSDAASIKITLDQLKNKNLKVKIEAAQTLRKFKAKEAVPQLMDELFKVSDRIGDNRRASHLTPVMRELCEAITDLGELEEWVKIASHRPDINNWRIHAKIINSGEAALPSLMNLLNSSDKSVHLMSAGMIAKIKRGEIVPEIEPRVYGKNY